MILVSIIVPVFNVRKYLVQCLESLISQTLQNIEIICIDDGSNDGSEEILDRYEKIDTRIRVFHKKNSGYGNTMNFGIGVAKGQYIGIVESDDFASPLMFEKLYNAAVRENADVVKANYYIYKSNPESIIKLEALVGCKYGECFCPVKSPQIIDVQPSIWSGIYKSELLQMPEIRFLETPGASFQDTSFIIKVWLNANRVYLLPEAYLYYRCDNPDASVKSQKKAFCICDEFQEIERYLSFKGIKDERIIDAVMERKFKVYEWNYSRLDGKLKKIFLNHIKEEVNRGPEKSEWKRKIEMWSRETESYIENEEDL